MKSTFKKIGLAVATAFALSGSASAALMNVGGVVWDPDAGLDFKLSNNTMTQSLAGDGSISGFARVDAINGINQAGYCPSGCELTFQYSGFFAIFSTGGNPNTVTMTGGVVNFYVDATPDASVNQFDPSQLTDGNTGSQGGANPLWLSLVGHSRDIFGTVSDVTFKTAGGAPSTSGHLGVLDVVGGLAAAATDTNTILVDGTPNADFNFSFAFDVFPGPVPSFALAYGTGSLNGASIGIPEPTSLALVGLGMFGFGALRRRRDAK